MAKEQNMSLNPSKISGNCGRLMCCLKYEHDVYCDKLKSLPKIGAEVKTQDGIGEVAAVRRIMEGNGYQDIVVVKDATTENDKIEMDSEEDLQELQKMEKLDREEKWNHKAKDKK